MGFADQVVRALLELLAASITKAMREQAAEGRFLGGRPPYGYRLVDNGPHPDVKKAKSGQRAHRLELDEVTAPIVRRIFAEYNAGAGLTAIAEQLTADGVPCPSAADPERNRHRTGDAWQKGTVRTILDNARYLGFEVWNRSHHRRRNAPTEWVWSAAEMHEPIIDLATYVRAQLPREVERSDRYALAVSCTDCGGRMWGNHSHGRNYYRCHHVRNVREDDLLAALGGRTIASPTFDPQAWAIVLPDGTRLPVTDRRPA